MTHISLLLRLDLYHTNIATIRLTDMYENSLVKTSTISSMLRLLNYRARPWHNIIHNCHDGSTIKDVHIKGGGIRQNEDKSGQENRVS